MNFFDLKKKLVLITGSDKGIGKKLLESFAKEGANIISCLRSANKEHVNYCKNLSNQYKVNIYNYYFNLENNLETSDQLNEIKKKFNKLDILVNNAGINHTSLFEMTSYETLKKIFEVNFFSTFFLIQKLLSLLKKGEESSIINLSSTAAIENNAGRLAYASSKNSINSLTKILSKEFGRYKIRVNAVAPGLTNTAMMKKTTSEKNIEQTIKRISIGRIAEVNEIANVVLFLASNLSSYVNGQIIKIDGGLNESI